MEHFTTRLVSTHTRSVGAARKLPFEISFNYQLDAIFVYFDMFRAYTPIFRSIRIILSFTNAAYGVL